MFGLLNIFKDVKQIIKKNLHLDLVVEQRLSKDEELDPVVEILPLAVKYKIIYKTFPSNY